MMNISEIIGFDLIYRPLSGMMEAWPGTLERDVARLDEVRRGVSV